VVVEVHGCQKKVQNSKSGSAIRIGTKVGRRYRASIRHLGMGDRMELAQASLCQAYLCFVPDNNAEDER